MIRTNENFIKKVLSFFLESSFLKIITIQFLTVKSEQGTDEQDQDCTQKTLDLPTGNLIHLVTCRWCCSRSGTWTCRNCRLHRGTCTYWRFWRQWGWLGRRKKTWWNWWLRRWTTIPEDNTKSWHVFIAMIQNHSIIHCDHDSSTMPKSISVWILDGKCVAIFTLRET